ncbi:MAG: hypothetical protein WA459_13785 [Stellaceae bacterium]
MRWMLLLAAAIFAIALALPARAGDVPSGFINIIRADRITMMIALDPDSARAYFDTDNSYGFILRSDPASLQAARQLKAQGWRFRFAEAYFNLAAFQADVAAHAIEPGVTAVVYDNEDGATREGETGDGGFDDPRSRRAATRDFYKLAKAHDLTVILAPGTMCNAANVFFRRIFTPQACYAYLRDVAPYADIIDPQFQGLIPYADVHLAATRDSAALMKASNPSIRILSEFTTNPQRRFTPAQNIAAMRATLPYVNGLWTNLNASRQGIEDGIHILRAVH